MGKKAKEHRQKVAKRNAKIKQQKSAMQKAFDALLKAQVEEFKNKENAQVKLGDKDLNFEVLEEEILEEQGGVRLFINPSESEKINKEFEEEQPVEDQISELEK